MSLSQTTAFEVEPPVGPQSNGDRPRQHLLDLDDFGTAEILTVLNNTSAMKEVLNRDIKKVPTLRGRVLVTLFYEPSTGPAFPLKERAKS